MCTLVVYTLAALQMFKIYSAGVPESNDIFTYYMCATRVKLVSSSAKYTQKVSIRKIYAIPTFLVDVTQLIKPTYIHSMELLQPRSESQKICVKEQNEREV